MNSPIKLQPLRIFYQSFLWYFANWKTALSLSIITMIPSILCVIIFPSDSLAHILSFPVGLTWLIGSLTYYRVISMRDDKYSPSVMESMSYALRLYLPLFLLTSLLEIASLIGLILLVVPTFLIGYGLFRSYSCVSH